MGKRILLFFSLFLLAAVSVSCGLYQQAAVNNSDSSLTFVKSDVFSGGNVHIKIEYDRGREDEITITCDTPDGKGGITQFTYIDHDPTSYVGTTSFDITLTQNGTYTVKCRLGKKEMSTTFTIKDLVAPTEDKAVAVPTSQAREIIGTGTWTENFTDPTGTCTAPAIQVSLQLNEDNTAILKVTRPIWSSFTPPCGITGESNVYNVGTGIVDRDLEMVTYSTCIDVPGGTALYKADGMVTYSDNTLKGKVTCFDTSAGLTSSVVIQMP